MEELLDEVKVREWEEADDAQVQEALNRMIHWESRRLEIGKNFVEYKGVVQTWNPSDVSEEGSEYSNLKLQLEDFNVQFLTAVSWIKQQDKDRNLGKGSYQPDELSSV